mgnify:CR=1 FL=1
MQKQVSVTPESKTIEHTTAVMTAQMPSPEIDEIDIDDILADVEGLAKAFIQEGGE